MAGYTVTAAWSGAASANGGALTVKVLTGAALVQNGVAVPSNTVTTPQLATGTGVSTGSWVYGVVGQFNTSATFTANGSSTFSQNFSDGTNNVCYGTFRSTGTMTGGSSATLGATLPTESSGLLNIALAEILVAAGQTLAEDASSPTVANTVSAKTLTTASFTPPPGSLIVVQVTPNGTGGTPETTAVSSVPALTFAPLVTTGASTNASLGIWIARVPPATQQRPVVIAARTPRRGIAGGVRGKANLPLAPPPPTSSIRFPTPKHPRGLWRRAVGTAPPPPVPAVPPRLAPQARRPGPARGLWRRVTGTSNLPPGVSAVPHLPLQPRRLRPGRGLWRRVTGTANLPPPTIGPIATWTGGSSVSSGFFFPYPAARPTQIPVANVAGDWMFAIITWRQATAGAGVTVSVADDAHNYWEPLGAPTGDSSAAGVTRTAIWYAPAARAATIVQVAPSGFVLGLLAVVADVTGMSKWFSLSAITPGFANAATALSLGIGAPASQALMLAGVGTDSNGNTITGPGAGWTALPTVSATNGVDTTADIQLHSAWRLATVTETAAWSSSGTLDLSGVTAGILVTTAPPAQPNPNWPVIVTELAPGGGVTTPPSQTTWAPLSPRQLAMTMMQGRQYTLGQLQAGQGTMTLDNPDGALIPPGTGAFAGIDSGTPVRQRIIIPASATPYYVPFSGFFQRWPFNLEQDMLRGQTQATILDAWAYAGGALTSMAREEILLDFPYAYWPCGDPAGSAGASNLATGNANPLTVTTSKLGGGGSQQVFGANSGALVGDSAAKVTASGQGGGASGMWSQALAGVAATTNGYGYALTCTDTGYPSIANGVTIEGWFGLSAAPPAGWTPVIWSARNVKGPVMELDIDQATGHMIMRYGPGTGPSAVVTVSTNDWRGTTAVTHVAIAFNQTNYQVIIDGGAFTGASGTFSSPLPATFTRFDAGGIMDSAVNGYAWPGYTAHLAIFPAVLSPIRVLSHYFSTRFGMVGEAACDRVERILEYASLTGRRLLLQQPVLYEGDLCVSGQDIGGQPAASSISNISASTVPAMMYVAPTGDMFYAAKLYQWNDPIRWVLGENTAAGEIPYLPTMATDYDPAQVRNDIQITQLDTSAVTIPGGNAIGALEAASQNQYGDVPYQVTGYMQYDASSSYTGGGGLNDLASWVAYTYRKPQNRIQSVTVDAATHPSAWNFVAGVSVGDMVTVNLRPPTAAAQLVAITARVTQTNRSVQFSQNGVTGAVTCVLDYAPEENALICDDATRGLLNGTNVIGW